MKIRKIVLEIVNRKHVARSWGDCPLKIVSGAIIGEKTERTIHVEPRTQLARATPHATTRARTMIAVTNTTPTFSNALNDITYSRKKRLKSFVAGLFEKATLFR